MKKEKIIMMLVIMLGITNMILLLQPRITHEPYPYLCPSLESPQKTNVTDETIYLYSSNYYASLIPCEEVLK